MPEVVVTRQFLNGTEVVLEGRHLMVTERRMQDLIKRNLVSPARSAIGGGNVRTRRAAPPTSENPPTPAARPAADETTAVEPPARQTMRSTSRLRGGQTGEAKPSSSSRQGRPRSQRRSRKAGDAPVSSP